MSLLVQKFGGTSVGSIECIRNVASKIINSRDKGHQIVVVLSAMSGETDRLIQLTKKIQAEPDPREYAVVVATGEQISIGLLAMELISRGYPARSYTAPQAKILTDNFHKKARILEIDPSAIKADLVAGIIPVVAGFQGIDVKGDITTLGRGGSDTTAVALAASLDADECQIFTDVEGVYTADPRIVHDARRLTRITFEEMLELSSSGAKVLQNRAVEFVGKYKIPLRVLSSFVEGSGTLITFEDNYMEKPLVSGIAFNRNEAKLTMAGIPDVPGVASKILDPISDANIDVDMILQNGTKDGRADFTFTVSRDDYQKTLEILDKIAVDLGAREIIGNNKIAKLSLVGVGMRSNSGVASKMFSALGKEGINIQFITTSEIKISVVVDEKYLELGARTLHAAFELENSPSEEFDPL